MEEYLEDHLPSKSGEYLPAIGIPTRPSFQNRNLIHPVLPRSMRTNGVMILGAYPTAVFERIENHVVPVGNVDEPFDPKTASGRELDEFYLAPLGLQRGDCWITNLVKVFLFKPEHAGSDQPQNRPLLRSAFEALANTEGNRAWLGEEIRAASPQLIITLGREVAGIVRGVIEDRARNELLGGSIHEGVFEGIAVKWVHLPHPGIVMRKGSDNNPWPERHAQFCEELKPKIRELITAGDFREA